MAEIGPDDFVADTVVKKDIFSETIIGHVAGDPTQKLTLRNLANVPWYARPISGWLARKEIRALRHVQGIAGTPQLFHADRRGILRDWVDGVPIHLAKPADALWYHDAKRLLREMRRRGLSHNDLAKPQNWLALPDGRAAVIDFQLAMALSWPRWLAHTAAREDLRHLVKQKRRFAPHLLVPSERRLLERKSLITRVWLATGKKLYNFITRRLMHWQDGEGFEDIVAQRGPAVMQAYGDQGVRELALSSFALGAKGVGLYAFVVAPAQVQAPSGVHFQQSVPRLPVDAQGQVWQDVLDLIANNRLDEVELLLAKNPDQAALVKTIIKDRLNVTDRYR